MLNSAQEAVVRVLTLVVPPDRHLWALTGSAGLRLQGVPIDVHDLDVQTDRPTAQAIVRGFRTHVRTRLYDRHSENMRSYFAVLEFEGVTVEVMGDISKLLPDGSWETPVDLAAVRVWVDAHEMRIPVVSLEHEWRAYRLMGRAGKAARIRQVMKTRVRRAGG